MKKKSILLVLMILFGTSLTAQVPSYVPTAGLQGWWPFSGNADDAYIYNHHGTVTGTQLGNDRFGTTNSCYQFDGISDTIKIPSLEQDSLVEYSISAWFNTTVGGPIVCGRGANGEAGITLHIHDSATGGFHAGKILFVADAPATAIGKMSSNTYFDSSWHHVVGIYIGAPGSIDSTQFQIYIDTVLVAYTFQNAGAANAPIQNNTPILFGAHQVWPAGGIFTGYIDDIGIWNRALTFTEVKSLYKPDTLTTGIVDPPSTSIYSVYPNPVDQQLTINATAQSPEVVYSISDVMGRQIMSGYLTGLNTVIDLSQLTSGIYVVHIGEENLLFKMIKQ